MFDINKIAVGMIVEDFFAVINVEEINNNGRKYIKAALSHKTGSIYAKIWEENISTAPLIPNKVFMLNGRVDNYRGSLYININQAYIALDEKIENHLRQRNSLVFDIETAGKNFSDLDEWEQEYLLEKLEWRNEDKELAKQKTALYPLFSKVVAIGMLNTQTGKGQILGLGKYKNAKLDDVNFEWLQFEDEAKLLEHFWHTAAKFEHFITFNGNGFDWPFLLFRSAINKIKATFEITRNKEQQTDLLEKFKSNNTYSLESLCRAFGITNPKDKGVSGLHVSYLFTEGKYLDIANYVSRDVFSTWELYKIWKEYMAGRIVL